MSIRNLALLSYILSAGITGVLRLGPWLPLSNVFLIMLLPWLLASFKRLCRSDLAIVLLYVVLGISSILHPNTKTLNYLLAYGWVFGVMYLGFTGFLKVANRDTLDKVLRVNSGIILFTAAWSISEFVLDIFGVYDLKNLLPRVKEASAIYTVGIKRSYGFATEPTTLALYFNIMSPYAVLLWRREFRGLKFFLRLLILFLGWFLTFSASGYLFLVSAIISSYVLLRKSKFFNIRNITTLIFIGCLIYYLGNLEFFDKIVDKISLKNNGTSATQRTEVALVALERFRESPFLGKGVGLASSRNEMSAINWYLEILVNGGMVGLSLLLYFLYHKFIMIRHISRRVGLLPMVSFLSGVFGFITISTFYNPFFWISLALAHKLNNIYDESSKCLQ